MLIRSRQTDAQFKPAEPKNSAFWLCAVLRADSRFAFTRIALQMQNLRLGDGRDRAHFLEGRCGHFPVDAYQGDGVRALPRCAAAQRKRGDVYAELS
jgi:hypothetical protein